MRGTEIDNWMGATMDKIRKPEREVCVHKDADNEPDCCDCFFHNRLCDEWEAYIKQMIVEYTSDIFLELVDDHIDDNPPVIARLQKATLSAEREIAKAIRNAMLKKLGGNDD